ncbi:MAG: tetratricopeptide repeat protein [Deltaproteobacteria bacterium]|nr:tetratricopeptide repeat protein [Deltaproteobacteria bacterium]
MKLSLRNNSSFLKTQFCSVPLLKGLRWGVCVAVLMSMQVQAAGPALDNKPKDELQRREQLHLIRMKQIPLLEQAIRKYHGAATIPEMMFRLGEAYFETAKYYEVKSDKKTELDYISKAQKNLEALRSEFPAFSRLDEALFILANSYMEVGDMQKAGSVLAEISDRFPKSPILKEAALLLGDYYFDQSQYAKAENFYHTASTDPKIQSYVTYKLAWVSLNQNQQGKALQYFEKVISLRDTNPNAGDYAKDAAREMVFPALQVYSPKKVISYLEKVLQDAELVQTSLTTLTHALMSKGEYEAVSQLFENLETTYPHSKQMGEWVSNHIKAEEALGRTSKIPSLVARLNENAQSSPQVAAQLLGSARKFHSEAQKSKTDQDRNRYYDLAIGYYQGYLQAAQQDQIYFQTQFYLGEALFAKSRFAEAVVAYESSAKTKSDVQAQAAWNWFLTAEKLAAGFRYQGTAFHATEGSDEKYLEAARFLQTLDSVKLEQKRKASYQSARLLYQLNDLDRALPVFQTLAERFADSHEGKLSSQLVLDIYNLRKDYKSVAQFAQSYQKTAVDGSSKSEYANLEQQALLKSIEEEERVAKTNTSGDKFSAFESVARRYMEFVKSYPQSTHVDAALWAAIQNFMAVAAESHDKSFAELRAAFQMLTSKYSNSRYTNEAISLMGKFLAYQVVEEAIAKDYSVYRPQFLKAMRSEPKEKRGLYGKLIYRMSDVDERKALVRELKDLPLTEENREMVARGQLLKLVALKEKLDGISLSNPKTLGKNTQAKIKGLEELQGAVTEHVKMKVGETAVEALKILGAGYDQVAKSLKSAPVPKGITGENLTKYRDAVNEKAVSLEDKGKEALRLAEDKAKEFNLSHG